MKINQLSTIQKKRFGNDDVARLLGITASSASVLLSRYEKQGYVVRLKRGLYVLASRWASRNDEELFELANIIQVPSYISFMTALVYWGVSTQLQRGYIESAAVKRTYTKKIQDVIFTYTKLDHGLYGGFKKINGYFIAAPEKAFVDCMYLASFYKYSFDRSSLSQSALNPDMIRRFARDYPARTKELLKKDGYL